jgi:hypothetical protein
MSKLVELESAAGRPAVKASNFPQRRKFLALPLEKRREILKAQASDARAHYARSTEWREWESAELGLSPK